LRTTDTSLTQESSRLQGTRRGSSRCGLLGGERSGFTQGGECEPDDLRRPSPRKRRY
jgi:hypothetical protein